MNSFLGKYTFNPLQNLLPISFYAFLGFSNILDFLLFLNDKVSSGKDGPGIKMLQWGMDYSF